MTLTPRSGQRADLLSVPLSLGALPHGIDMASRRETRIAENQTIFRVINERITAWPERQAAAGTEKLMFYCECGDVHCFDRVYLTAREYEAIRADSSRFAVVAGHVFPEAEDVVAKPDGYEIVEKHADLRGITEGTDPRKAAHR